MDDLKDKAIICTGAGSGIGRAAAVIAAAKGAKILVADLNADSAEETVEIIRRSDGEANAIKTDIASESDVEAMVARALELYGKLDCAFNNAAIPQGTSLTHEMTLERWQRNIDVTLTGTFLCIKYEVKAMLPARRGSIVNTSSGAGLCGFKLGAEYSAAKHGVIGLTRSAALDYAEHGIRINAIAPGAVRTPMLQDAMSTNPGLESYIASTHPIGRIGEPPELGQAAVWLMSDAASFVTGTCLVVDGGYMA